MTRGVGGKGRFKPRDIRRAEGKNSRSLRERGVEIKALPCFVRFGLLDLVIRLMADSLRVGVFVRAAVLVVSQ